MFFDKLARHPRVDLTHRLFYKSLVEQLAFGSPRRAKCYWQTCGVTLDMCGNIGYCPAQSPILGSALEKSAWQIFREGISERRRIVREYCDDCQYDSPVPLSTGELVRRGVDIISRQYQQRSRRLPRLSDFTKSVLPADHNSPAEWQHVLITGWYGTETTGDKAVLAELVHVLKLYNPGITISITTIDEKVSRQTNKELGLFEAVQIIDIERAHHPQVINNMDAVIIGGGPLMEVGQIENVWRIFRQANDSRVARVIFGCGVGPIHTKQTEKMIGDICRLATIGFFRDEPSHQYALRLGAGAHLRWACDPSLAYLTRWRKQAKARMQGNGLRIAGLLREQTKEYYTGSELQGANSLFIQQICETIHRIISIFPDAHVELLPMHMYWKGNDDRIFNRKVLHALHDPQSVYVVREYLEFRPMLDRLYQADIALAMRYHGHLFSLALGIPFLSIDYTNQQGKVSNLIREIGYQEYAEDFSSFRSESAARKIETLLVKRDEISRTLVWKTEELVNRLDAVYADIFGEVR